MVFRKTLDLEVHRKTFVTFDQWLSVKCGYI
jgi:hypothetical protein